MTLDRRAFLTAATLAALRPLRLDAAGWRAGVATVDITPRQSLWMAGFAARTQPSQGTAQPLHAKALARCRGEVEVVEVRKPGELAGLDGLIVPGGELARARTFVRPSIGSERELVSTWGRWTCVAADAPWRGRTRPR